MNADGTSQTRLTTTAGTVSNTQPALSPDGARITFTSNRDGNNEIYVMNADGTNLSQLTHTPADSQPVFSPDGTQIAFTKNVGSGEAAHNQIFVMNAFTGAGQTNLIWRAACQVGRVKRCPRPSPWTPLRWPDGPVVTSVSGADASSV